MMAAQDMTDTSKPLADEIAAYTDEELNRYLEENGRVVSVQDPENISHEFLQRLRDIAQRPHKTTKSCVDLDEVAARLQTVPSDAELFNRSPSLATTASSPPREEVDQEDLRREIESYHALVEDGSCTPYPFHLLQDFFWNPEQYAEHEQYRDIIFFWQEMVYHEAKQTCFCACQLATWKRFRKVQRIIRERSLKSELTLIAASEWDSWEIYVDCFGPKEGKWGFSDYVGSMRRRLAKYGFTRPFQLNQDPDQQDRLTTWIEYLGYEYWFYDMAASYVKGFQRHHDHAWNKLVETNLLGPDETYEAICNIETSYRHSNETKTAEEAEASATAAVSATEKAIAKSQGPAEALKKRLLEDLSALSAVRERLKTIETRNDAITDFLQKIRDYRCEKEKASRYLYLLRWIEQQIPSIEVNRSSLNSTAECSDQEDRSQRLKRGRSDEPDEAQHFQGLGHTECNDKSASAQRAFASTHSPSQEIHKRSRSGSIDDERPRKRPKGGRNGLASDSTHGVSASATLALVADTGTNQELDSGNVTSSKPLAVFKPLRRSSRIASKMEAAARIAHIPTRDSHRLGRYEGGTGKGPPARKNAPARRGYKERRSNGSNLLAARKGTQGQRRNKTVDITARAVR